jgi:hypothetical protein
MTKAAAVPVDVPPQLRATPVLPFEVPFSAASMSAKLPLTAADEIVVPETNAGCGSV